MKKDIHPQYTEAVVTCGCGESFTTRSTRERISVEICSKCHPFYTGKQKLVDTAGRVEKFQRRYGWGLKKEEEAKPEEPGEETPAEAAEEAVDETPAETEQPAEVAASAETPAPEASNE